MILKQNIILYHIPSYKPYIQELAFPVLKNPIKTNNPSLEKCKKIEHAEKSPRSKRMLSLTTPSTEDLPGGQENNVIIKIRTKKQKQIVSSSSDCTALIP